MMTSPFPGLGVPASIGLMTDEDQRGAREYMEMIGELRRLRREYFKIFPEMDWYNRIMSEFQQVPSRMFEQQGRALELQSEMAPASVGAVIEGVGAAAGATGRILRGGE